MIITSTSTAIGKMQVTMLFWSLKTGMEAFGKEYVFFRLITGNFAQSWINMKLLCINALSNDEFKGRLSLQYLCKSL